MTDSRSKAENVKVSLMHPEEKGKPQKRKKNETKHNDEGMSKKHRS